MPIGTCEVGGRGKSRKGVEGRFWEKVDKTETCWLWKAAVSLGYGIFWVGEGGAKYVGAHRYAYELLVGPIPNDPGNPLQLDHLCRVRNCVNPAHLEVVTSQENKRRGISPAALNAYKTHCLRGHPYNEANTYIDRKGWRQCRQCNTWRKAFHRQAKLVLS